MRAPKCRTCGVEHWGSVCAQAEPVKKSTAARKDVPEGRPMVKATREMAAQPDVVHTSGAGTQAPPVGIDPISVFVEGVKELMLPAPADPAMRPGPGRPRIHNDRKAYKAAKQREYRQRQKEAGK